MVVVVGHRKTVVHGKRVGVLKDNFHTVNTVRRCWKTSTKIEEDTRAEEIAKDAAETRGQRWRRKNDDGGAPYPQVEEEDDVDHLVDGNFEAGNDDARSVTDKEQANGGEIKTRPQDSAKDQPTNVLFRASDDLELDRRRLWRRVESCK